MIRENQRIFNIALVIIDFTVITLALVLAWYIRFATDLLGFGSNVGGFYHYILPILLILPSYIFIYYLLGLYTPQRTKKTITSEAFKILQANVVGLFFLVTMLFVLEFTDYSRYMLAMFGIFSTVLSITERFIIRKLLQYLRSRRYNIKYILVIGTGELARKFSEVIIQNEYLGYDIMGFLDENHSRADFLNGFKILGTVEDLEDVLSNNLVDRAVITLSHDNYNLLEWVVETCEKCGVRAEIIPSYYSYMPTKPYLDVIEGIPLIQIRHIPLDNSFNRFLKRCFDLILVLPAIVILSPLLILVAFLVKLSSSGPVIFQQERLGLDKKSFQMYKFRSMKVQDEEKEKFHWTTEDDPRKTGFGSFIRRTSIDELPQFFNILKGEMSLIGPRPERPHFAEKFKEEIPKYMVKHHVRPGMTGWAQVNGYRGNTSIKKRIEHDIYYVENWTTTLDVKIFFKTLINLFRDENAY
ncbi:undecaprenyl-phosphate glucose phosphotransferase [Methanobacterium sp. BAmetb5]|uniref:undecaprenyl-phosphate glucose phosphotransferase n=1 Tax=Methanobacterium sp. BAmetb5 TaxID=2025351 RepID=UPI000E852A3A|nr:undecaprenyl-phosphate glucose phosphotransferase [Methanobacterium sp. BAmetb5]AXV40760.1 MAG: undecaprenyl-phosphate glucose phosphotransferase [Methanobacterium sp. BAmetb5]